MSPPARPRHTPLHRLAALGWRPLLVLVAAPVAALVAGLLTVGAHAQGRPVPLAAGDGCTVRTLRFEVTQDPAEVRRQAVFERSMQPVTPSGFFAHPVPVTPTLHAASHGSVVVFFRPGTGARELRPLHALVADALTRKAPVTVAPRRQAAALVALGLGRQLTCTAAHAAQTAHVRAFASGVYPELKAPARSS